MTAFCTRYILTSKHVFSLAFKDSILMNVLHTFWHCSKIINFKYD